LLIFSEASGALTALAFLVVLRVLIKLFFSIDMAVYLLKIFYFVPQTLTDSAGDWPKLRGARKRIDRTQNEELRVGLLGERA
jgi:hypothetical protein